MQGCRLPSNKCGMRDEQRDAGKRVAAHTAEELARLHNTTTDVFYGDIAPA